MCLLHTSLPTALASEAALLLLGACAAHACPPRQAHMGSRRTRHAAGSCSGTAHLAFLDQPAEVGVQAVAGLQEGECRVGSLLHAQHELGLAAHLPHELGGLLHDLHRQPAVRLPSELREVVCSVMGFSDSQEHRSGCGAQGRPHSSAVEQGNRAPALGMSLQLCCAGCQSHGTKELPARYTGPAAAAGKLRRPQRRVTACRGVLASWQLTLWERMVVGM